MGIEDHGKCYLQIIDLIHNLWQKCKMVHGDLSAYNLLFNEGEIYIIDVSQSVEWDHPLALFFLKRDILNITRYYRHLGVKTFPNREVLTLTVSLEEGPRREAKIEELMGEALTNPTNDDDEFLAVDIVSDIKDRDYDEIVKILERIDQAEDSYCIVSRMIFERYMERQGEGEGEDKGEGIETKDEEEAESDSDSESLEDINEERDEHASDDSDSEFSDAGSYHSIEYPGQSKRVKEQTIPFIGLGTFVPCALIMTRADMDKEDLENQHEKGRRYDPFEGMSKEERKKKVKEEQREKRKTKMPKKEKKKLIKKKTHKK